MLIRGYDYRSLQTFSLIVEKDAVLTGIEPRASRVKIRIVDVVLYVIHSLTRNGGRPVPPTLKIGSVGRRTAHNSSQRTLPSEELLTSKAKSSLGGKQVRSLNM